MFTAQRNAAMMMAAAIACTVGGWGCAGGAGASVRHQGRPAGQVTMPLQGVYRATIIPPFDFIGPISGRISAEPTKKGFIASTRPGVAWDMIGGVQGFLGSLFVPFIFPGGTIGTWTSTAPTGDKPGEGWFGVGGIKSAGLRTRINSSDDPVELLVRDGRRVGLLLLEPDSPDAPPTRDYAGLAEDMAAAVRTRLFDADLVGSSSIRAYMNQVRANARIARDDVEFIFGTVAAARNHVKFTMPLAFPKGDAESRAAMTDWTIAEILPLRASLDRRTGLAYLRVDAFLTAADVDTAFAQILKWNPKGVIIDLRSAPGVTLASLRTLSWVATEPVDAGVWFGPGRRKEMLASVEGAARMDLASAAGVEEIEAALDASGAVHITVKPEPGAFNGPLAVLTSKRTSASAETLVWALQSSGRGGVYGQATAGKPMLSRPIDLRQGWVFWLAACDYRTPAGTRIPETGIKPDFEFSNRDAAARAAERKLLADARERVESREDVNEPGASLLSPFFKAAGQGP